MSSPLGEFPGRPVFKLLTMTSLSGKSPKDAPCSVYLWLRHFSFVSEYNLGHLQEEPAGNWGGLIMHPSRHKKRVGTARITRSAVATQPWLDRGAVLSLFWSQLGWKETNGHRGPSSIEARSCTRGGRERARELASSQQTQRFSVTESFSNQERQRLNLTSVCRKPRLSV
jgi:hypothetical protein